MTPVEERILKNQHEIMWALHYLLGCAKPDLVGKGGQLDSLRDDILHGWKAGKALLDGPKNSS